MLNKNGIWLSLPLLAGAFWGCSADAAPRATRARPEVSGKTLTQPLELGLVRWQRDFEAARQLSKKTGKPLLVLFDEIPGCSTVRGFGKRVLSHPLVVEAAETLFVPVLVKNNVGGRDRAILRSFNEPTWNNPVVRIIDHRRAALVARFAGPYTVREMTRTMVSALQKAKRPVPRYLQLLLSETTSKTRRAVFAMGCFWSGEAKLGALDGVVKTRVGWLDGHEVVSLAYDPDRLSDAALVAAARKAGVAGRLFSTTTAQLDAARRLGVPVEVLGGKQPRSAPKDDKYQLRHSRLWQVPMTALQRTKVNAALGAGSSALAYLSPRQQEIYRRVLQRRSLDADLVRGWSAL